MAKLIDFIELAGIRGGYRIFLRKFFDSRPVFSVMIKLARAYRRIVLRKPRVCAVIGSLGKTTTTRAVRAAVGGPVRQPWYSNYGSSLACNLLAVRPWDPHAVLEAGIAYPGMMDDNSYILKPDMVVATAIAWEHFRTFKSQEEIRDEKVKIIRALPPAGWAVLNGDDPHIRWMASQTRVRVIFYGFGEDCDVRLLDFQFDWPHGMTGRVAYRDQIWNVRTRMFGRHFWYSLLAGLAAAVCWDADIPVAIERLADLLPTPNRLECIDLENDCRIMDDTCKGGFDSWLTACATLEQVDAGRKIVVCGDIEDPPGSRAETYRHFGEAISQAADAAVFFGSGSDLLKARNAAHRAGMARENLVVLKSSDWEKLAETVRGMMQPGDVILVKGRSAYRLQRVVLALQNRTVTCPLKICNIKVHTCDECPMLERRMPDFQNHYILPYIKQ